MLQGWGRRTKSEGAGGRSQRIGSQLSRGSTAGPLDGGGEPERVKEREHLGRDGVDDAVDDADDGDREAARNLRNGKHRFFFLGIGYVNYGGVLSATVWGQAPGSPGRCYLT